MKIIEEHVCFGGQLKIIEHYSDALGCNMKFSIFIPPHISDNNRIGLFFLSGLTCDHENFTTKAGAYQAAAQEGLVIIAPDTSPRGSDVSDHDDYDFGQGAGFYINATQSPWAKHYQMETYIFDELRNLVISEFKLDAKKIGIMGHSMGGHGALTLYLKYPEFYSSVSAFAPIVAPAKVPWGHKAFKGYLGSNENIWQKHDACALLSFFNDRTDHSEILIDQGKDDPFLKEQLKPELFQDACNNVQQKLKLRLHDGYDHSYYFIQSFIDDHISHHMNILK